MPVLDPSWLLLAIAALGSVLAVLFLIVAWRALRRVRPVRASVNALAFALCTALAVLFLSLAANVRTYQRFVAEQPVLDLQFEQLRPRLFRASLREPKGSRWQFDLHGDEWQVDARVLKWSGVATVLGFRPQYRLDRISGRYHDPARAQSAPRSVHPLSDDPGLDLWSASRLSPRWIPWVDAVYGSATFLPMRDGAAFRVMISNNGLLARPANEEALKAVADWQ